MKKITFLMALCLSALTSSAVEPVPTVTTLWENSAAASKLPTWFLTTTNKTRGIGASNDYVFLPTREDTDGKNIFVFNAATGVAVSSMNTSTLSGGTFVINDLGVTEDGKIIAASLGANTNFKIYMYNDKDAVPTVLLHIVEAAPGGRTGDLITVTGDYSKGTAKIYTASATAPSQIWVLEMANGVWKTERELITTMTGPTAAVSASVAPKPNGEIYWKAAGQSFKRMNSDKTIDPLGAGFSSLSGSIKYLGYSSTNDLDYVALFTYGTGKECAEIVALKPGDLTTCKIIGRTASLGANANVGGTGDLAVRYDANNNPIIYVVSTNNGFGAYKIEGLNLIPPVWTGTNNIKYNDMLSVYPNPATDIISISEQANSVKVFNVTGQLVKELYNTNTVNVSDLQGIYIMNIETANGKATRRISVK